MKINDKNLSCFATSMTPVDKEGYLNKRELNKASQKRWFILKGNLLFYFEKRYDKEPVGVIVLEGCTIELAEDQDAYSFKIIFHGPGNRSYTLAAENQDSMEQWMKCLACSSYDYMKLMVSELQRQLDELDGTLISTNDSPQVPPRRHNPFNNSNNIDNNNQYSNSNNSGSTSLQHCYTMNDINSITNTIDIKTISPKQQTKQEHNNIVISNSNINKTKITFRELHMMYGRSILRDKNEYRYQKQQEQIQLQQKQEQQFGLISL